MALARRAAAVADEAQAEATLVKELEENGTAHQQALDGIIKTVAVNRDSDRELFRRKRRELVELVEMLGRD